MMLIVVWFNVGKLRPHRAATFFRYAQGGDLVAMRWKNIWNNSKRYNRAGTSSSFIAETREIPEKGKKGSLENDFSEAIKQEQFTIHYQPIIHLSTNKILAAEALIRWDHPTKGILLPQDFIPIAEQTEYITAMGDLVLNQVCRDYKRWKSKGLSDIRISINISSMQFLQDNFVENIGKVVKGYGLNPDFLIIEILERYAIDDYDLMVSNIQKLRRLGIQVALDDFGTGFSSLEYLSKLDVDIVKLDRYFVKSLPGNRTNVIIIENLIHLAGDLKLKVIAEGIETADQLAFLKKLNCYAGQGYLYCKPIPDADFCKLIARDTCYPSPEDGPHAYEKRSFFRIEFPLFLEASMTILKYNKKDVRVGSTRVLLKNMGGGGLCFLSDLHIPEKYDLLLRFTATILEKEIKLAGTIVWMKEIGSGLYQYGVRFKMDEEDRMDLIGLLNQFQVQIKE